MKNYNSLFQAVFVIAILCAALSITEIGNDFFFKAGIIVLLLFIGYILKEILLFLKKDN